MPSRYRTRDRFRRYPKAGQPSVSRTARAYRTAVVKKGENLEELAKRLKTSPQELIRQNKKLYSYKGGAVVKVKKSKATGTKWRKKGRGRVQAKEIPEAPIYIGPYAPGYQAPEPERERMGQVGTWISNYEAITGRPVTFDLGRRRITTTRPMQYTGYAEAYAQPPQAAPSEALRPDITGALDEETYNRLYYISVKYTADTFRYAKGLEDDLDRFNIMPNLLSARMAKDLNLSTYDMEGMGYERVGNWWRKISLDDLLTLEEITPSLDEAAGGGYGGAGAGGYGYRGAGGYGRPGGRGVTPRGEDEVKPATQTYRRGLYPNITLGNFMRNVAGRLYTPEFGGMIHWRL